MPSRTHVAWGRASGQRTTVRGRGRRPAVRGGREAANPATAGTPAANTLMIMSGGSSCSAPRRTETSRGVAARSMTVARRLPVRRWAKCRPSKIPGRAISRRKTQSPARPARGPSNAMQSSVRAGQPRLARLAETTSDTTSWPRPREPERITAR
jgi:hypothetical protein